MNEEELEAWYEEEKERIFEAYEKAVQENKEGEKGTVKLDEKFKKDMKKLRKKYDELFTQTLKPNKVKEYSKKIRTLMDKLVKIYK